MQGRAREEAGQGWLRSAAFRWEACDAAEVVGSSPAMCRCISVPLLLGAQSKNIVWLTLRVREAGYVGLVAWSGGSMACLQSVWSQLQDHLPQHVCLICLPYVSALCVCSRCGLSCRTICHSTSALYVCLMCLPYVSAVGVVSAAGPFAGESLFLRP